MLQWQGNAKNVTKAFQRMFEKMGGFQVQALTLQASGVGGGGGGGGPQSDEKGKFHQNLTEEAIDAGFDYIETHGPRTHHANTQLKWITKQLISEESPIKNWPERLIKEALRNLMNDGVLALAVHDFPLTLVDVVPAVLFILEKLFPYNFTDNALGMHGVPNVGKTPLGRIIAMAMSRYWVRKLNSKANLALGRLQSLISFGAKPVEKIGQICSMWWLPSRTANAETQRLLRCELPNSRKAKWESTWSMISTFQQGLSMK